MYLYQMMNNKLFLCRFIAVLACYIGFSVPVFAQELSQLQLITRAEAAINDIKTLQARFTQKSSDGTTGEGLLYFRRPAQLRLEYKNPETLTLITSKIWLYVDDKITKTVEAYPVSETPLAPILRDQVKFHVEGVNVRARTEKNLAIISLIKDEGEAAGQVDLEFELPSWRLRRWVITDLLNIRTAVNLQNTVYDLKLPNRLFGVPSYDN